MSHSRQNSAGGASRGRGGNHFFSYGRGRGGGSAAISKQKFIKAPTKAANPLNQYFLDNFTKLKKDADFKSLQNLSHGYRKVIHSLAKYPIPILCAQQAHFLEGVGDTTVQRFAQMIADREKEFEDKLFYGELANIQKNKEASIENENVQDDEGNMNHLNISLKQYLVEEDRKNFLKLNGIYVGDDNMTQLDKKRKIDLMSQEEEKDGNDQNQLKTKKRKLNTQGNNEDFLDVGSVSWTLLLACYFLTLHDDNREFFISFQSIQEMIDVLEAEFGGLIPIVSETEILRVQIPMDLEKLRESGIIESIDQSIKNPLEWKMLLTKKGQSRVKGLCKNIGLVVNLEVDLENKSKNKIIINMYDKDLMPVLDDLYIDGTQIKELKQEEGLDTIFDPFINELENEICDLLGSNQGNHSKFKKEETSILFNENFCNDDALEDEDDDIIMDDVEAKSPQLTTLNSSIKTQKSVTKLEECKIKVEPTSYESEVILFVDNREKKNMQTGNYLFEKLSCSSFHTELKALPLGDFLWVLRVKLPQIENKANEEDNTLNTKKKGTKSKKPKKVSPAKLYIDYVLDFIVERKTADDLAASIRDGRYDEQKYRLKHCGINNVIYLVEGEPSQYCKIPSEVLKKAQIHTQVFHGFNIMRISTIQDTLDWLKSMTNEITLRVSQMKQQNPDFHQRIMETLQDFKSFSNESGKNSNLNIQHVFARQLRTLKGLGAENCATITRVFKTPFLLNMCFQNCSLGEKQSLNLLNAGKMQLLKNQVYYRQNINEDDIQGKEGDPYLPRKIEDVDKIDLKNVEVASNPKLFNKLLKEFETETGIKMKKINKNQCKGIYDLFRAESYDKSTALIDENFE